MIQLQFVITPWLGFCQEHCKYYEVDIICADLGFQMVLHLLWDLAFLFCFSGLVLSVQHFAFERSFWGSLVGVEIE